MEGLHRQTLRYSAQSHKSSAQREDLIRLSLTLKLIVQETCWSGLTLKLEDAESHPSCLINSLPR